MQKNFGIILILKCKIYIGYIILEFLIQILKPLILNLIIAKCIIFVKLMAISKNYLTIIAEYILEANFLIITKIVTVYYKITVLLSKVF